MCFALYYTHYLCPINDIKVSNLPFSATLFLNRIRGIFDIPPTSQFLAVQNRTLVLETPPRRGKNVETIP